MKKACSLLLMFCLACLSAVNTLIGNKPAEEIVYDGFRPQDFVVPLPKNVVRPTPEPNKIFEFHKEFIAQINSVEITYTVLEYDYIGTYFITAYCPSECGWNGDPDSLAGWYTASDTICHRADEEVRLYEPTTCAIDRRYHSFGDLFYIEEFDRVFVAEDTGSAVKGKHLDLFYEDYYDVITFPTGYYAVYSVEYVTRTIPARENTRFTFD